MSDPILLVPVLLLSATAFVACVRRPARTIIPVYALTLPLASVVTLHVPLPAKFNTLSSALGALAVLALVLHLLVYRDGRIPSIPDVGWLLLLAWISVTALWAVDPSETLSAIGVAASLIVLLLAVSMTPTDAVDLDVCRTAIILSGLLVGVYALFLILAGRQLPAHGVSYRLSLATSSSDTDPNILAASLLVPMVLSVERILLGGSRWWSATVWRAFGVAGAFFSFLAIVFTASRGGLVAAVVAFVVCLVRCGRLPGAGRIARRVVEAIVAAVLAVAVVLVIRPQTSSNEAVRRILGNVSLSRITQVDASGSGRLDIWTAGYRACLIYCGWGAGHGDFPDAYNALFALSGAQTNVGLNRPAHDIYLQAAVEDGFIGLALLVMAFVLEGRAVRGARVRMTLPSAEALLVAILIANVFLSAMWFKYFWLTFVLFRVAENADPATRAGSRFGSSGQTIERLRAPEDGLVAVT